MLREIWDCKHKQTRGSHGLSMMRHQEASVKGNGPAELAAFFQRIMRRAPDAAYLEAERRAAAAEAAAAPQPAADDSGYSPPAGLTASQAQLLRDLAKRYEKMPPASVAQVMDRYVTMVKSRDDAGCAALRAALKLPASSGAPAAAPATAAVPTPTATPAPAPPGAYVPPAGLDAPKAQLLRNIAAKYKSVPAQSLALMMRQYEASVARMDERGVAQMRTALDLGASPASSSTASAAPASQPAASTPAAAPQAATPAGAVTPTASGGPEATPLNMRCPRGCPPMEDDSSSSGSDSDGAPAAPVFCGECGAKLVGTPVGAGDP